MGVLYSLHDRRATGCGSVARGGRLTNRARYHVALVHGFERIAELEAELNHYADRGWRVVAMDGMRVVFEEEVPDDD